MKANQFLGYPGNELPKELLAVICNTKIRKLGGVIEPLRMGLKINPGGYLHEALFLRSLLEGIMDESLSEEEILSSIAALPVTVGSVPVLDSQLGAHLGILVTHRRYKDAQGNIEVAKIGAARPLGSGAPWVDAEKLIKEKFVGEISIDELSAHGYEFNANSVAYCYCPGWAQLKYEGTAKDPSNVEVVNYHPCSERHFEKEGWHAWRCPSCKTSFDSMRGVLRNRDGGRSVDKIMRGLVKGDLVAIDEF
jgi:hypothetical protein